MTETSPGLVGRISLVTLGVRDLDAATAFYTALGWHRSTASVEGVVSFFGTDGARLSLFSTTDLAADAHVPAQAVPAFRGVALAVNLESAAAVDAGFAAVLKAGGRVVRAAERTEWGGYSGYFADPDGHLWELAHNPGFPLGEDGLPQLP
ncbi:VOC family protein [Nakamurella silvestris]|nr:VOC family protein [Nakamurella silvestris]